MNYWCSHIAIAAAVTAVVGACGYCPADRPDAPGTDGSATFAVAASGNTGSAAAPPTAHVASPLPHAAPPPNAEGDPACPASQAWGRDPRGVGILVSYWSDDAAVVTVLVRTMTGTDRTQRDSLSKDQLRLFEFPEIDQTAVREVLIMTNTIRCFATPDPVTFVK
jgi:hypothetical protein